MFPKVDGKTTDSENISDANKKGKGKNKDIDGSSSRKSSSGNLYGLANMGVSSSSRSRLIDESEFENVELDDIVSDKSVPINSRINSSVVLGGTATERVESENTVISEHQLKEDRESKNRGCLPNINLIKRKSTDALRFIANKSVESLGGIFTREPDIDKYPLTDIEKQEYKELLGKGSLINQQDMPRFEELDYKVGCFNKNQFLKDPIAMFSSRPIRESEFMMKAPVNMVGRAIDREACIASMRIQDSSMFSNVMVFDNQEKNDKSIIHMHYLPFNESKQNSMTLNGDADYFYTSQLGGCSLIIDTTDQNHPRIVHVAGTYHTVDTNWDTAKRLAKEGLNGDVEERWKSSLKIFPQGYDADVGKEELQNVESYPKYHGELEDRENFVIGIRNKSNNTWDFYLQIVHWTDGMDEINVHELKKLS